jgi:hypothetical protein
MMLLALFCPNIALSYRDDGAGACGLACGAYLFICVAILALNIAILVWVAKDAKSRGMGSAIGWVFLTLITGVLGLVIYLFSRPSGDLVHCEHCNNRKLMVARLCPHCGNESKPFVPRPPQNMQQQTPKNEFDRNTENQVSQPVQNQKERTQFCSQCGSKLQGDNMFCSDCGSKIIS